MKSKVYDLGGKLFRYDFDRCAVEYVTKADEKDLRDEAEWLREYGYPLFGIDRDGYMVFDSIGLSSENWEDRDARDGFLSAWRRDLEEEGRALAMEFEMYELPYMMQQMQGRCSV